ncbi:MAG: DUF493 domain-containing protein [Gammaproteobacteria bacterium]|nr:DUF493 domain-containing protein [Gammaproteobacteria bacterium]
MPDETLLEFPCQFSIKAFGLGDQDFPYIVHSIVETFVEGLSREAVRSRPSRKGKYLAVTVTFTASSQHQLDNIYRALTAHERVVMAL